MSPDHRDLIASAIVAVVFVLALMAISYEAGYAAGRAQEARHRCVVVAQRKPSG